MCVIFQLRPGYTLPKKLLDNAVNNNPHGYGIIIKRDNKLEVIKDTPENGNDPDVIYKILKDNEDAERFVHVRWRTAGTISEDNTQPFKVYADEFGREIWFAHNGTLNEYATRTYVNGVHQQNDGDSDSKKFAENVLIKYLPKLKGDAGIADIQDRAIQDLLDKYWSNSYSNKGILICSDLDPYYFGLVNWKTINVKEVIDGKEVHSSFFASNDDYFERMKRGPLFEKLEQERKKREEEEKAKNSPWAAIGGASSKDSPFSSGFLKKYGVSDKAKELLEDFDFYDPDHYVGLSNLTYHEIKNVFDNLNSDDRASVALYITHFLKNERIKSDEASSKLERAQKKIESLAKKVKKYEPDNSTDSVQVS